MITGIADIQEAYRDDAVARRYVAARFEQPLGALLHARQAAYLIREIRRRQPAKVLEIAPGPARLTTDVAAATGVRPTLVDASRQMLAEAAQRMAARGLAARCIHGDAFSLPFGRQFDCVYSFRLIRHFGDSDRRRLYSEIQRVLRPGGFVVFDAVNEVISSPIRRADPASHQHYDALFTRNGLIGELQAAGFRVLDLHGVQHHYGILRRLQVFAAPRSAALARAAMELVDRLGGRPLEWIVMCQPA